MATRRILYFTAEGHHVYLSAGASLELEAKFAGDDLGVAAFREHLRGLRGALFSVVADLAGEDFHEDRIPFLRGSDREAVLQRRLSQRYRDTRLATALSLGYVLAGERRYERVLLASFTNTQGLTPWLDALEEAGAKLAGVYSVPLLAPALAAQLGARNERALVLTANRAGLRECFVEGGKLRFARLERAADLAPEALALFVRSEASRLAQYLVSLRALPRDAAPVRVLVVAPPGQQALFDKTLVSDSHLLFRTLDHADALRAVKLHRVPQDTLAEALYLHLAVTQPPREQFASSAERRGYFVWRMQRGIVAAGIAAFVLCGLYASVKWLDVMELRERTSLQRHEARFAAERYQRITATFPVTHTSTENVKVSVVEFNRIAGRSAAPERAFVHLSRVLEQFPQVELDGIKWSVGRRGERGNLKSAGSQAADAPAKAEPQGDFAELLEVSGRVNATQRNDYRSITAQVQRFAGALKRSGYELERTQLPFDVTSEGTLSGDIGGTDSGEAPRFTIVLARRLP